MYVPSPGRKKKVKLPRRPCMLCGEMFQPTERFVPFHEKCRPGKQTVGKMYANAVNTNHGWKRKGASE